MEYGKLNLTFELQETTAGQIAQWKKPRRCGRITVSVRAVLCIKIKGGNLTIWYQDTCKSKKDITTPC